MAVMHSDYRNYSAEELWDMSERSLKLAARGMPCTREFFHEFALDMALWAETLEAIDGLPVYKCFEPAPPPPPDSKTPKKPRWRLW